MARNFRKYTVSLKHQVTERVEKTIVSERELMWPEDVVVGCSALSWVDCVLHVVVMEVVSNNFRTFTADPCNRSASCSAVCIIFRPPPLLLSSLMNTVERPYMFTRRSTRIVNRDQHDQCVHASYRLPQANYWHSASSLPDPAYRFKNTLTGPEHVDRTVARGA